MQQKSKWDSLWREGRQSCLLLIMLVLLLYWPALNDTVNTVDDPHILNAYGINGHNTLARLFLPGGQFYYRPFIELSFYLDNLLWGLEPRSMHLENVLIHICNAVLVYLIAQNVFRPVGVHAYIPLLSALLFALHPVNTESVNWIAGRTDPLAAVGILLSVLFLLKAVDSARIRDVAVSGAAACCALLTKETSVMLAPVSLLLLYAVNKNSTPSVHGKRTTRLFWYGYGLLCTVVAGIAGFRVIKKPASSDNAFSLLFKQYDIVTIVQDCFTAVGFYLKKLFIPLPLNFAIDAVHPVYIVPGVLIIPLCWYLLKQRNITGYFFLATLLFILPAALVMVAGLNWTPVAERYLYIPSAFFSVWCAGTVGTVLRDRHWTHSAWLICGVVLITLAGATFQRNWTWRDNLSLFEDTVKKSPQFGDVRNDLGLALARAGRYDEAREHFVFAAAHAKRERLKQIARMNLLNLDLQGKTVLEKERIVEQLRKEKGDFHEGLPVLHASLLRQLLFEAASKNQAMVIYPKLMELNDQLYRRTNNAQYLYFSGQYALALGEKQRAYQYFAEVVRGAPIGSELSVNSAKLLKAIAAELNR